MKITEEIRNKGQELASKMKVNSLYVNDKGEFFTTQNLASLSVDGKKDRYQEINFAVTEENFEVSVELIRSLTTIEEVQEILNAEIEGTGSGEIIDACEARIKELEEAE